MMTWQVIVLCIVTGILSGGLSGFFGIGGGIVIVPALVFIFSQDAIIPSAYLMQLAAGTSLAAMFFIAQVALYAHRQHYRILWPIYRRMVLGLLIGATVGAVLAAFLKTEALMFVFALFLLFLAVHMLKKKPSMRPHGLPNRHITRIISIFIGGMAGLLGISAGTLTVPFFARCRLSFRKTTSVVALASATVALTGTLFFFLMGWNNTQLPAWSTGYIYWPAVLWIAIPSMISAPFFAQWSYKLSVSTLKKGFIIFLFLTGARMLLLSLNVL